MTRASIGLVVSLLLGCGSGSTPAEPAEVVTRADSPRKPGVDEGPGDDKAPKPSPPEVPTVDEVDGDPKAEPPSLPDGPGAASPWKASVQQTLPIDESTTLLFAADSETDSSTLWAQAVDDEGKPAGPAVELRKTNGEVESVAGAFDGVTLWVGWVSRLSDDGRRVQGLAGFDLSLKPTIKTRSLRFYKGRAESEELLQMVARPGVGAGVTVVALAGTKKCKGMHFEEEGMTDCQLLAIDLIAADGTVQLTETSVLDGGDPDVTITKGDTGLDVEFLVWHGGANTDNIYISYTGSSKRLTTCTFPPAMTAWVDGGLLSMCRDADLSGDEIELSCSPGNISACGTFYFTRPEGAKGTTSIPQDEEINFDRLTLGCKGNTPTVRVSWKTNHFDMPAAGMGFKGKDAVVDGGKCKGKSLP